ncbi:MAG: TIGR00300 family protein [bacterium]|nr:TIGR00300 family protein [bacterium]
MTNMEGGYMFVKTVIFEGHILDSLTLSKVLDRILEKKGRYELLDLKVGHKGGDGSSARVSILAEDQASLEAIMEEIKAQGGTFPEETNAALALSPGDGVFPDGFYSTTNLETYVRFGGEDIRVENEAMDLGIAVDSESKRAFTIPMSEAKKGQRFVVGTEGVTVVPLRREKGLDGREVFGFMKSEVSVEKPRRKALLELADSLKETHERGEKNLLVLGPAVVHSGASESVAELIRQGVFDILFGGNAVAAHDIERELYGTSLGISLKDGAPVYNGHQHHLRAINTIRGVGGISNAIDKGLLKGGIMHAAYSRGLDIFLAGSIRDDGPLPEVCTDTQEAKKRMRQMLEGVGTAVMAATALHSIAAGNMLKASVRTYCVDINPEAVIKLMNRGSLQTTPLVMDCESFFHELSELMP